MFRRAFTGEETFKFITSRRKFGWTGVCKLSVVQKYAVKMEAADFSEMLLGT
jgi:hypothetical protein